MNHSLIGIFGSSGMEIENPEDSWDPKTERVLKRICQDIAFEVVAMSGVEFIGSPAVLHG